MSSSTSEVLEALLQTSKSSTTPELKVALTRLSLEMKERAGRGSSDSHEFFASALHAISRIRGAAHAELRWSCLLDSAGFFIRAGSATSAFEAARLLSSLAGRTQNKRWIRIANTVEGVVHAEYGDVGEGVVKYTNALVVARALEDRRSEGVVFHNLGTALNYAGLYHEAICCSEQAIKRLEAEGDFKAAAFAHTNIAQCCLSLGDYLSGLKAVEIALNLSHDVNDAESAFAMCIREFTYVHLALGLGDLEQARGHSALCRTHSQWGNNPRCKVLADITAGLCEIRGGSVELGFKYLEAARSEGTHYGLKTDALTALAKAYDEAGRPEQALQCLRELLGAVRSAREKGIFALMSLQQDDAVRPFAPNRDDLRAIEMSEAKLETKVAKRESFNSRMEMLARLAVTADLKEESSGEHGYRVGRLAALLAANLGWDDDACAALDVAARLHDIGKIGVPDRILFSSQGLKKAERHFINTHTTVGAELLAKSSVPALRMAEEIAHFHHEWWNGEGYPSRLARKRIPIHARIVALADVFDALTHGRPFAEPWSVERAIEEIRSRRGTQFDPELTDIFLKVVDRLRAQHANLDEFLGSAGRTSPFLQARDKIRRLLNDERDHERKAAVSEEAMQV